MNAFYEHHKDSIQFGYRCFDRLLLNGLIQPFQQRERVVGFFNTYRQQYPVSRDVLREIATQFQNWTVNRSVFPQGKTESGGGHREGPRTGPHHDRHREQEG